MHPYINIYTEEEEEDVDIDKKDLDLFFEWLKCDGLKPRKSERLWKKTILTNLLNDEKMTLENYYDFIKDKENIMKKTTKIDIDTFDYAIVINQTITTGSGKQKIINFTDADSMVHLFFESGNDLLVSKIDIRKSFGK